MAKKIEVQIIGDASSFSRALKGAERDTRAFGSGLDRAVGTAVKTGVFAAAAAGIAGITFTLKRGIQEYQEAARVGAQTNAVIKSTGGIANVTAGDVDRLSESLMKKSGVDDEVIASGQNMLLTFKNIRNEAGAGNDIFNQATKATLDFSVAMGKDMQSAAIMVGKALNDPIRGLTALGRAGVQFSDSQKETIKRLVETGRAADAQRVILKELTSQFGGSAEAAGRTLPGQLDILRERFNNFAGDLVSKAIPAVNRFFDFIGEVAAAKTISAKLNIVVEGVASVAGDIWNQIQVAFQGETRRIQTREGVEIEVVKPKIVIDWSEIRQQINDGFSSALESDGGEGPIDQINEKWTGKLGQITDKLVGWAKAQPGQMAGSFRAGLNANDLTADFGKWIIDPIRNAAANAVPAPIRNLVTQISAGVRAGGPGVLSAFSTMMSAGIAGIRARFGEAFSAAVTLGSRVVAGIRSGLGPLIGAVREKLGGIIPAIIGVAGQAFSAATRIGSQIVSGVLSGLGSLYGAVKSKIESTIGSILSNIDIPGRSPPEHAASEAIGQPLGRGVIRGWILSTASLPRTMADSLRKAIEHARSEVERARDVLGAAFDSLTSRILRAFDAQTAGHETATEQLLREQDERRRMEDLIQRQADAQTRLNEAIATGDAAAIAAATRERDRATEDIARVQLEKQAEQERKDYESSREELRIHLEKRLEVLGKHWEKVGVSSQKALNDLNKLLLQVGLTSFADSGKQIGQAFVDALQASIRAAAAAAAGVGQAAGDPRASVAAPVPAVVVNLPNYLGDKAEVAQIIRTEIERTNVLNGIPVAS